jgi:NAD(P)-dependent dehydrogenase (short-subunit alcohol dehydrogenase family)
MESDQLGALDVFRLDGQVALVTGASAGLGASFAQALASAGAAVVVAARRADKLEQVCASITERGGVGRAVVGDVRDEGFDDAVLSAAHELGGLDVLVNNAAVSYIKRAEKDSPDRFADLLHTNLTSVYRLSGATCRDFVARGVQGSIVNISSIHGLTATGIPAPAYTASKAALIGLTRELASEWSPRFGIRVNALAPGYIISGMTASLNDHEKGSQLVTTRTLLSRMGRPEELTGALLLLASRAGSYMTGTTVVVDGGWTLY